MRGFFEVEFSFKEILFLILTAFAISIFLYFKHISSFFAEPFIFLIGGNLLAFFGRLIYGFNFHNDKFKKSNQLLLYNTYVYFFILLAIAYYFPNK